VDCAPYLTLRLSVSAVKRSRARKGAENQIQADRLGQCERLRRAVDCAPYLTLYASAVKDWSRSFWSAVLQHRFRFDWRDDFQAVQSVVQGNPRFDTRPGRSLAIQRGICCASTQLLSVFPLAWVQQEGPRERGTTEPGGHRPPLQHDTVQGVFWLFRQIGTLRVKRSILVRQNPIFGRAGSPLPAGRFRVYGWRRVPHMRDAPYLTLRLSVSAVKRSRARKGADGRDSCPRSQVCTTRTGAQWTARPTLLSTLLL